MTRKGAAPKREVLPDPMYQSVMVTKLINKIMYDGKRGTAEKALYSALDVVADKTGKNGLEALEEALNNIMPTVEVKARRVGGANYQVPIEVRADRRETLGIRWLVDNARKRGEKGLDNKLAGEIMDAINNTGGAVKKKEDTHKMAEANRAFAHYRW